MVLTRVDRHADPPVTTETLVAGALVLVRTRVDTGGVDMADALETRVYG